MEPGITTHFVELPNCIIIIKNVPCEKCSQCGEVVYDGATAMKLDEIAEKLKNSLTEIAVVQFPHAA
jgi:YgiT-type zinc finger domain-containing protein